MTNNELIATPVRKMEADGYDKVYTSLRFFNNRLNQWIEIGRFNPGFGYYSIEHFRQENNGNVYSLWLIEDGKETIVKLTGPGT